ncbi:hypothetical protein E2C01_084857 [Portunus trituberculatus]|uniref:Uncharacterized protein n=1 Tax=Portunus trituberculatus TaxID=210409 RepID=A0A5B7JC12_PORTR|nr:hypothetical protein [Portunus trituberculatus]
MSVPESSRTGEGQLVSSSPAGLQMSRSKPSPAHRGRKPRTRAIISKGTSRIRGETQRKTTAADLLAFGRLSSHH